MGVTDTRSTTSRRGFLGRTILGAGVVWVRSAPGWASRLAGRKKKGNTPLFEDTFHRTERDGWGRAWFNQRYGRRWTVKERTAYLRFPAAENNIYYRPTP